MVRMLQVGLIVGVVSLVLVCADSAGAAIGVSTLYEVPLNGAEPILALGAGPEGDVWFTTSDGEVDSRWFGSYIGRATPQGVVSVVKTSAPVNTGGSITVAQDGSIWWLTRPPEGKAYQVVRATQAGAVMTYVGDVSQPEGPARLENVTALAAGPNGRVYLLGRDGIASFSDSGQEFEETILPHGEGMANADPGSIAIASDGAVWFGWSSEPKPDVEAAGLARWTPSGGVSYFTLPEGEDLVLVRSLAAGPDGSVYFSTSQREAGTRLSSWDPKIGVMAPSGELHYLASYDTGTLGAEAEPAQLTVGPEGDVWFTNYNSGGFDESVGKVSLAGEVTEYRAEGGVPPWAPAGWGNPGTLVFDGAGNPWYTTWDSGAGAGAFPDLARLSLLEANTLGFVTQPASLSLHDGEEALLVSACAGSPTYLWEGRYPGQEEFSPWNFSSGGYHSRDLNIEDVGLSLNGVEFRVRCKNAEGEIISEPATLSVSKAEPVATVTALSPKKGPADGGTVVALTGTHMAQASAVDFGDVPAESFKIVSSTEITAVAPPDTGGATDVTVTDLSGTSASSKKTVFTYGPPTISAISPSHGPAAGGTTVTITGNGFAVGSGTTAFLFGKIAATSVVCASDVECSAVTPANVPRSESVLGQVAKSKGKKSAVATFRYE